MKAKYDSISEECGNHFTITLEKLQKVNADLEKINDQYKAELYKIGVQ